MQAVSGLNFLMLEKGLHIFGNLTIQSQEVTPAHFSNLPEVIAQRTTPGILIFNSNKELVYINSEAREVLVSIGSNGKSPTSRRVVPLQIPDVVTDLCDRLKLMVSAYKPQPAVSEQAKTPSALALSTTGSEAYSFRAFFLSNNQYDANEGAYVLILIERVSTTTKKVNLQKASQRYKLSKREIEVVELLILGHKNKEIADRLCVCVYTIEDHIKKVMKKMGVRNRTSVIAKLLES